MRQEGILLSFIESMNFIHEEHGRATKEPRRRAFGARDLLPDILDAAQHRRERDEIGVECIRK